MTQDYNNAIKTGNGLLRRMNPNAQTKFLVNQYLAEAYCMLGQTQQAMECLRADSNVDAETKIKVDNVANQMKEPNEVSQKIVQLLNQSAIMICAGNMDQAKGYFE